MFLIGIVLKMEENEKEQWIGKDGVGELSWVLVLWNVMGELAMGMKKRGWPASLSSDKTDLSFQPIFRCQTSLVQPNFGRLEGGGPKRARQTRFDNPSLRENSFITM